MTAVSCIGDEAYRLIEELYPICRSITGDGVRETLARLSEVIPLQVHEVPSGTRVLDWEIPDEWNIRDAWIKDARGRKVVDFQDHNLHIVSYSEPIHQTMPLPELQQHLFSLPEHPTWIPYRTRYYDRGWGFCLTHQQRQSLSESNYEVCIDATLEPGSLTYGELLLPGESPAEIVISSHVCHPSLCNDNLSSVSLAILLAREWSKRSRRLSLRFLFAPGTIGAITWLSRNRNVLPNVVGGLTLTCLGDGNPFHYKRTLAGDHTIDRAASRVLSRGPTPHQELEFFPYGYDERQYNSAGFRLPFGSLMRARHQQFAEYHTSADNLEFVKPKHLSESFEVLDAILQDLNSNDYFMNLSPHAEPQLGRRGVIDSLNGDGELQLACLWVLNLSDGRNSLLDIAERSNLPVERITRAAKLLEGFDLIANSSDAWNRITLS